MALLSFYQQTFGDSPRLDFYVRNVHCTASACRSWAENASDVLAVKPMSPGVKAKSRPRWMVAGEVTVCITWLPADTTKGWPN